MLAVKSKTYYEKLLSTGQASLIISGVLLSMILHFPGIDILLLLILLFKMVIRTLEETRTNDIAYPSILSSIIPTYLHEQKSTII